MSKKAAIPSDNPTILIAEKVLVFQRFLIPLLILFFSIAWYLLKTHGFK